MKFFKNYRWRYVIIDDKLPCFEDGEIVKFILKKRRKIKNFNKDLFSL